MEPRALLLLCLLLIGAVPSAVRAQEADTTPPTITVFTLHSDHTNTAYARLGSTLTLTLEVSEAIAPPAVTLNGVAVAMTAEGETNTRYVGTYTVTDTDTEGAVAVAVTATDLAGNEAVADQVSDGAPLIIDRTAPVFLTIETVTLEMTAEEGTPAAYPAPLTANSADTATCNPVEGTLLMLGTYEVVCAAYDAAGNTLASTTLFSLEVVDTTPPTIVMRGDAAMALEVGAVFTDPGFYVLDNASMEFVMSTAGAVDTAVVGVYTITYTATDDSGNIGSATRTVTVGEPEPEPEPVSSGGGGGGGGGRRNTTDEEEEPAVEEAASGEVLGVSDEHVGEVLGARSYLFTRFLREGDTGEDVRELQMLLAELGYLAHEPTGYFGPLTRAALGAYQAARQLEAVGYIGPRTLALLNQGTVASDPKIDVLIAEIIRLQAEVAKLQGVQ